MWTRSPLPTKTCSSPCRGRCEAPRLRNDAVSRGPDVSQRLAAQPSCPDRSLLNAVTWKPERARGIAVAVYTDVVAEDLGAFLAGYDIGELLAYKGIAEGVENSNFLVHTSRGYFILTLYEKRVAAKDLPFFLALMEHLHARGLTCPQPVKNSRGEMLGKVAGRPAAVITFLDGMWIRRPSAAHCGAVGAALARLHLAGADFPLKRRNALSVEGWRPLYVASAAGADSVQPGLREMI